MHSFGLEECNHYAEAEKVARKVIIYIYFYIRTVYRDMFTLVLFSPLSPSLSVGEFKTGRILKSRIISL